VPLSQIPARRCFFLPGFGGIHINVQGLLKGDNGIVNDGAVFFRPVSIVGLLHFIPRLIEAPAEAGGGREGDATLPGPFLVLQHLLLEPGIGGIHGPLLSLPGDFDELGLGNLAITAAVIPNLLGQAHQGKGIADRGPGLAEDVTQLLLGVALLIQQALDGLRLFDDGEVLALKILDQGDLGVVPFDVDGGEDEEADLLGRQVAALTGDDEEVGALIGDPEEKGLEYPVLLDGGGQLGEGIGLDDLPGLFGVRLEINDGELVQVSFFVSGHFISSF